LETRCATPPILEIAQLSDLKMPTEPPVISFENVTVTYANGNQAICGATFRVEAGECLALVGESGSGKTTMARAVMGLLPTGAKISGSIRVAGKEVVDADASTLRGLRGLVVGLVAQDPFGACNPLDRVSDHVAEAWLAHGMQLPQKAVNKALDRLGIEDPDSVARRYPHQWSGGMLQRATIAAARAHQPQLIVADEPTSALDADLADTTIALLRSTGTAVLLVSHNINLVARHADRIAVCHQGNIVEIGRTEDVINHPQQSYTTDLIAAGSHAESKGPSALKSETEPVLEAKGVSRFYSNGGETVRAVVSADLRGEIVGIYGNSGCGKSTLLRLLATIELPNTGTVKLGGRLATSGEKKHLLDARARSGYVMPIFQDPMSSLDRSWSIWRTVTEPLMAKHRATRPSVVERCKTARERLNQVGLEEVSLEARPEELSIGQCQRVSIARALMAEPALIIADEPTSALDTLVAAKVLTLLTAASEQGIAIVIVSHDQTMLHSLCHRVLTMRDGVLEG
jgi:peptide/nickel transport system ATP-binding protein